MALVLEQNDNVPIFNARHFNAFTFQDSHCIVNELIPLINLNVIGTVNHMTSVIPSILKTILF